jgi:chromatin remodeling complex protein RSC6
MDVSLSSSVPPVADAAKPEEDATELNARAMGHVELIRTELALLTGVMKLLKKASKRSERGTRRKRTADDATASDEPKRPSGFARPSDLSEELCAFLGVPGGTSLPRTVVTKMMCEYIKQNELGLSTNKRCVDFTKPAAERLRRLLDPEPGATVTYFNLQRYLKRHIRRAEGDTSTTTTMETAPPLSSATPAVAAPTKSALGEVVAARKKPKKEAATA